MTADPQVAALAALLHPIFKSWTHGCGGTHVIGQGACQDVASLLTESGVRVGDDELRAAAQAVVDAFDTTEAEWTHLRSEADAIDALRAALAAAYEAQP